MEERIELDRHDVLFILGNEKHFVDQRTIKALEIGNAVANQHVVFRNWKNDGVECEVLQQGGQWVAGRAYVRAVVDFVPDEPEPKVEDGDKSVLDDLRQKLIDTES